MGAKTVERVLSRQQLTSDGVADNLCVIYRREGHLVTEPFERETASTLFVDEPVAMLTAARGDELFFDILNSIDTVEELYGFVRASGVMYESGPEKEIVARISLHRCGKLL